MKKKIAMLMIAFTLVITTVFSSITHAIKVDTGSVGLWHVEDKLDQKDIAYVYARYNTGWGMESTGTIGAKNYNHWTPSFEAEKVKYHIEKPGEQYNQLVIQIGKFDPNLMKVNDIETITTYAEKLTYDFSSSSIKIISTDTNAIITTIPSNTTAVFKVYWVKAFGGDFTTIDKLPTTTGNIEREGGSMGRVKFHKQGLAVVSEIAYMGETYFIKHNFEPGTDMDIFNPNYLSYYYVDNKQNKMILINHGTESHFLNPNLEKFIPYTFWNLTTNEIKTVSKFDLFMHMEVEGSNNAFGYFYVDQFIIDNLLQVEVMFKYYYAYNTLPWDNKNGEVQTYSAVLEQGKTNTSLPTWQESTFVGTLAAVSVAAFFPVVRWPALLLGGLIMYSTANDIIDYGGVKWGNIDQIQKLSTISTSLATKLEKEYSKSAGRPVQVETSGAKKVYKLNFGQFNKFGASHIEFVPNTYKVISFTYETSDAIKVTYTSDDFDLKLSWSELLKPKDRSGMNPKMRSFVIYGIIALYIIVLIKGNGLSSSKKFIETTLLFGLLVALVYGIWFANKNKLFTTLLSVLRL